MAPSSKGQRPRSKPKVVLPPEAAYYHSAFPASTQSKEAPFFDTGSPLLESKTVFGTGSPAFEGESVFPATSTQVKGKSFLDAGSGSFKGFGIGRTQVKRGPPYAVGTFRGFDTDSTQLKGDPFSGTGSSSPLPQADPSRHPHSSIESGSDSELPTTESCSSLPSPSTSSPLTSTSSLSSFSSRFAIMTCEGGNGAHHRSVSAGTIPTHKRIERAPSDSRVGRSKSQGVDPVRNTNNPGEIRGDFGKY